MAMVSPDRITVQVDSSKTLPHRFTPRDLSQAFDESQDAHPLPESMRRHEILGMLQDLSGHLEQTISTRITRGLREVSSELRASLSPSERNRSPKTSSPKPTDTSSSKQDPSWSDVPEEGISRFPSLVWQEIYSPENKLQSLLKLAICILDRDGCFTHGQDINGNFFLHIGIESGIVC